MIGRGGNSVEGIRELVQVPERIGRELRASARAHPEDTHWVAASLKFRQAVLDEFDRFVLEGKSESDATEETYAIAQA